MSPRVSTYRLVIVGGGVAGLDVASTLARRYPSGQLAITLVDRDSAHIWKPMLHTIAAGTRDVAQQQSTYVAQAHVAGFTFEPGEMAGLNRAARALTLAPLSAPDGRLLIPERRIDYDTLLLAIGSQANDFGTPGVAEYCMRIDSRLQAMAFNEELRVRMLQALAQQSSLHIGIVGGGATGVELAAELLQMVESAVAYGAKDLPGRITVTLLEASPRLLGAFPQDISAATRERLERLGIKVRTEAIVEAADAQGFQLKGGERVDADLKVWAAGVKGSAVLSHLDGLEVNRNDQLLVRPSLQTTVDERIFAIGDCASLTLAGAKRPLPPTAQVAHQQAQHLIKYLPSALFNGQAVPDFSYRDFGALVSLGDYDAFGSLGQFGLLKGTTFRGHLAQLSHAMLYRSHQVRLHGFWGGSLRWLIDVLSRRTRDAIRLDCAPPRPAPICTTHARTPVHRSASETARHASVAHNSGHN